MYIACKAFIQKSRLGGCMSGNMYPLNISINCFNILTLGNEKQLINFSRIKRTHMTQRLFDNFNVCLLHALQF